MSFTGICGVVCLVFVIAVSFLLLLVITSSGELTEETSDGLGFGDGFGVSMAARLPRAPADLQRLVERVSVDAIVREEIEAAGVDAWQYFAVVPDYRATGVRDGKRAYEWPCIIRVINSVDVMTATVPELEWALLHKMCDRILAEVPGICRVCYELSPKPIATVEWE